MDGAPARSTPRWSPARSDRELAETFFNSITRRVFTTVGVDQRIEYVDSDFDEPPPGSRESIARTYVGGDLGEVIDRDPARPVVRRARTAT